MNTPRVIAVAALALCTFAFASQNHQQPPSMGGKSGMDDMTVNIHALADTKWVDGPPSLPKGAKMAVLEGDPAKAGPFVFRIKAPDGYRVPPHTHPKVERITVLQGQFNVGMGETFDEKATQPMPTGAYGYWPAGMTHFVWCKGETILQFHGEGPWTINYVNPADDPRNATRGAADGAPGGGGASGDAMMVNNQILEVGCGSCMYHMPGVEGCLLAVLIDGKTYLVQGAEWPNHDFCDRKIQALVTGKLQGDKFLASSVSEKK